MIIPDVNMFVHAYNIESPVHDTPRAWWEDLPNGTRPVGLAWVAILGFLRITTHRQILTVMAQVVAVRASRPGR